MATRYPQYEIRDGDASTPLSETYFNPVWKDIDTRIDALEQLRMDWNAAIQEIRQFGLERIDATLEPVLDAAGQALTESQAILTDLQDMIAEADIPAQIATAMGAFIADVNEALETQETTFSAQIVALQAQLDEVRTLAYAGL